MTLSRITLVLNKPASIIHWSRYTGSGF